MVVSKDIAGGVRTVLDAFTRQSEPQEEWIREEFAKLLSSVEVMDIMAMVTTQAEVKNMVDTVKAASKALDAMYDRIRQTLLPDKMTEEGVTNVTITGVGRVHLQSDMQVSIATGKKEEAYQWVEDTGNGSLIQPNINPSTLKKLVKDTMESGGDIPDGLFKTHLITKAVITAKH